MGVASRQGSRLVLRPSDTQTRSVGSSISRWTARAWLSSSASSLEIEIDARRRPMTCLMTRPRLSVACY